MAMASQLASVVALSSVQQFSARTRSTIVSLPPLKTGMPVIECAKHAQKKVTANENNTRPRKQHQPYDKNRRDPTRYTAEAKPPPILGFDSGDSVPDAWNPEPKETRQEDVGWENNEFDEDALEALFAQLEMDLEAEGSSDNEDLTEEEVIELENELVAALEDIEEEERREEKLRTIDVVAENAGTAPEVDPLSRDSKSSKRKNGERNTTITMQDDLANGILEEYEDADEEQEQRVITLEPWQLQKLAAAVQIGRRKVNVKALSAEVGMDRFDVLSWLKNPPPELLMYSATMDEEETTDELPLADDASPGLPANSNLAGKQDVGPESGSSWLSQKRLKKEHEATFEKIFRRTDRPSNAILQNLVELTHVPRKRVVEWFELRRKKVRVSPKFEALK